MTGPGIEKLNVYAGVAAIAVPTLFRGRGLDPERLPNLAMDRRSVGLPCEDPVTNAVNAAKPIVDAMAEPDRDRVELLITSSESGVDFSKSIASYVHAQLGLSPQCRLIEVKQACSAATAAMQLATGYVASGMSPGAKALVIATDVALVDERAEYSEPTTGFGAAAMVVGDRPDVLAIDLGAFGVHSYETMDSARPGPTLEIADVDRSLFAYLDCLTNSVTDYVSRVDGVDVATTFDHLAMHTPFAGLVRAAHRKLMREYGWPAGAELDADFQRRVAPSLVYPAQVGNLCSGSVFLALASMIDNAQPATPARAGLFSYGSGCSSEFYSGLIGPGSVTELAGMRLRERLRARVELTFEEYLELLPENLRCLVPVPDRRVDLGRCAEILARVPDRKEMLVLTGVEDYHRKYEWR